MVLEQQISPKNIIFFTPSEARLASPDGVTTPLTLPVDPSLLQPVQILQYDASNT